MDRSSDLGTARVKGHICSLNLERVQQEGFGAGEKEDCQHCGQVSHFDLLKR